MCHRNERRIRALLALVLFASIAFLPARANPFEKGQGGPFHRTVLGLCEDYSDGNRTRSKVESDMALARRVGARVLRVGIAWNAIEPEPGRRDFRFVDRLVEAGERHGLKLIPYVAYSPRWAVRKAREFWSEPPRDPSTYADLVAALALRYAGRVDSWEIWNEPDNPAFWKGTARAYARLVDETSRRVRETVPGVRLVLGGMAKAESPFLDALLAHPGLLDKVDVANLHAYHETWDEERSEELPARLRAFRSALERVSRGRPLWLAEFGYSSWRRPGPHASEWGVDVVFDYEHSPEAQALALWKTHVLTLGTRAVELAAWYRIRDLEEDEAVIGDANNRHLGLVRWNGDPKPALGAYRLVTTLFSDGLRSAKDRVRVTKAEGSQAVVRSFETEKGTFIVTGWLRSARRDELDDASGSAHDPRREVVSFRVPEGTRIRNLRFLKLDGSMANLGTKSDARSVKGIPVSGKEPFIATFSLSP